MAKDFRANIAHAVRQDFIGFTLSEAERAVTHTLNIRNATQRRLHIIWHAPQGPLPKTYDVHYVMLRQKRKKPRTRGDEAPDAENCDWGGSEKGYIPMRAFTPSGAPQRNNETLHGPRFHHPALRR